MTRIVVLSVPNTWGDLMSRMAEDVTLPAPPRVLVTAAATAAFYDLETDAEREAVAARLQGVLGGWLHERPGVRLLSSFDDDLFLVGDPRPYGRWSIFMIFEVGAIDTVVGMIDDLRKGDPRLHKYFTASATIGRAFWPVEERAAS